MSSVALVYLAREPQCSCVSTQIAVVQLILCNLQLVIKFVKLKRYVQFSVVRKKKMSHARNILIGLLPVVCLLQFDVIADVVTPCPTICECWKSNQSAYIVLRIDCHNRPRIDPQQLYKQIDSLLISYVNSSLAALTIRNSPLLALPRSVCRLTTLEFLDISDNRLDHLPSNCFYYFDRLTTLYARYNDITYISISSDFSRGMRQLVYLDLSNNKIQNDLTFQTFSGMGQLYSLHLSHNKIAALSDSAFYGMRRLNTIDISDNNIADVSNGVFRGMVELNKLYLSNNEIEDLADGVFDSMGKLNILDLSGNRIASIGREAFSKTSNVTIDHLYLDDNQLTTLAPWWYGVNVAMKRMSIGKNPWNC